jgi:hypothetical protein
MQRRTIAREEFDFECFLKETSAFLLTEMDEEVLQWAIVKVDQPGQIPQDGPGRTPHDLMQVLESGTLLFFPFSSSNPEDEPVPCADGESYLLEGEGFPIIGDVDCVGVLVQLTDSGFTFESAIHAGGGNPPPPSVELDPLEPLAIAMEAFLNRFVKA